MRTPTSETRSTSTPELDIDAAISRRVAGYGQAQSYTHLLLARA